MFMLMFIETYHVFPHRSNLPHGKKKLGSEPQYKKTHKLKAGCKMDFFHMTPKKISLFLTLLTLLTDPFEMEEWTKISMNGSVQSMVYKCFVEVNSFIPSGKLT